MITCCRRLEWDAMHRIPNHESKCRAFHGHRYVAEIHCASLELDDLGRVIDFGVVKKSIGGWIDENWDHTAILMKDDPERAACEAIQQVNTLASRPVYWMENHPTAENMVYHLAMISNRLLTGSGIRAVRIVLWETPNCSAEWLTPAWVQTTLED